MECELCSEIWVQWNEEVVQGEASWKDRPKANCLLSSLHSYNITGHFSDLVVEAMRILE